MHRFPLKTVLPSYFLDLSRLGKADRKGRVGGKLMSNIIFCLLSASAI